jgi:protein-disulfide isomerase
MSKSRRDLDNTAAARREGGGGAYVPGTISGATLAGVAVLVLLSYMNWQETRQMQRTIEARLGSLENRLDQVATRAAPAAAANRGPDPNRVYSVKTDGAPVRGALAAPVSIVEFSDFQCPFCGKVGPTLEQVRKTYGDKVRIVWKHHPLDFHKDAPFAHMASIAAQQQGKFWELHDKLFADPSKIKPDHVKQYARDVGVDMKRFEEDLLKPETKARLEADLAEAKTLGVSGTPAFFINGRFLSGAKPFEEFAEAINAELKRLNIAIPPGADKPSAADATD